MRIWGLSKETFSLLRQVQLGAPQGRRCGVLLRYLCWIILRGVKVLIDSVRARKLMRFHRFGEGETNKSASFSKTINKPLCKADGRHKLLQ